MGFRHAKPTGWNVLSTPLPEDRNEAGATEKSLWLTPTQNRSICSPIHLRPAATNIPTSAVQMTTQRLDDAGQEDSPQPQSSVAGHPYYQASTVLQTGARAGKAPGEPGSLLSGTNLQDYGPSHRVPVWRTSGPDGGTPPPQKKEALSWDSAPDI